MDDEFEYNDNEEDNISIDDDNDETGWEDSKEDINKEYEQIFKDGHNSDEENEENENEDEENDDPGEFVNIITDKQKNTKKITFRTLIKMDKYENSRITEAVGGIINIVGNSVPTYVIEKAKLKYGSSWDNSSIIANVWVNNSEQEPPIGIKRSVGPYSVSKKISELIAYNDIYEYSGGYGL